MKAIKLTVILLIFATLSVFSADDISVILNGYDLEFDQPPIISNGRTLVPMRAIFEALGAKVDWSEQNSCVYAVKDETVIKLPIGENYAMVNTRKIELDQPAIIVNSRTLVPVRFVAEGLGAVVDWNENEQTVIIKADFPIVQRVSDLPRIDPEYPEPDEDEILKNRGFEDGTPRKAWYGFINGKIELTTNDPYSGLQSGHVTGRGQQWDGVAQDVTDAIKEKGRGKYTMSAYVRCDKPQEIMLRCRVYDKNGEDLKEIRHEAKFAVGTEWTFLTYTFDVDWKYEMFESYFSFETADDTQIYDFFVDDCSLKKVS